MVKRNGTIMAAAALLAFVSAAAAQEKLTGVVGHHLEQVVGNLDSVQRELDNNNPKRAADLLEEAERNWKNFHDWNKGKFDPNHPDVVATGKRLEALREKVAGKSAKAEGMAEALSAVLEVITVSDAKLREAEKELRFAWMDAQAAQSEYRHIEQARRGVERLRRAVDRCHELLSDSYLAVREFRNQFADFKELEALVKDGRQATQVVQRVEDFPKRFLEEQARNTKDCLDNAEESIANYEKELAEAAGADEARPSYVAGNAEQWVADHADLMLQVVPAAFPALRDELKPLCPEIVKAGKDFSTRAEALAARVKGVVDKIGKARNEVVAAGQRRLEAARFPRSQLTGGEWDEAEKDIRKAWAAKIEDKGLLRVSIDAPWEVRSEARWRSGKWVVGTYRYIGAHCLAKLPSGEHRVYRMSFRNTRQPDASWSALEHWSVGHVYRILPENIDK